MAFAGSAIAVPHTADNPPACHKALELTHQLPACHVQGCSIVARRLGHASLPAAAVDRADGSEPSSSAQHRRRAAVSKRHQLGVGALSRLRRHRRGLLDLLLRHRGRYALSGVQRRERAARVGTSGAGSVARLDWRGSRRRACARVLGDGEDDPRAWPALQRQADLRALQRRASARRGRVRQLSYPSAIRAICSSRPEVAGSTRHTPHTCAGARSSAATKSSTR